MATTIPFHKLRDFAGLHNELCLRFGTRLTDQNIDIRLKAAESALGFMREQGFYVDDTFKYVTLPDNEEEHFMMMLKWS